MEKKNLVVLSIVTVFCGVEEVSVKVHIAMVDNEASRLWSSASDAWSDSWPPENVFVERQLCTCNHFRVAEKQLKRGERSNCGEWKPEIKQGRTRGRPRLAFLLLISLFNDLVSIVGQLTFSQHDAPPNTRKWRKSRLQSTSIYLFASEPSSLFLSR